MPSISSLVVLALTFLALLSAADASLHHGSHRLTRHNGRRANAVQRRSNSSSKCTRPHPPGVAKVPVAASDSVTSATPSHKPAAGSAADDASTTAAAPKSTSKHVSNDDSSSPSGPTSASSKAIFPVSQKNAWSMAPSVPGSIDLTEGNLHISSRISSISNPIGQYAGRKAMLAKFPAGQWGLEKSVTGGMSWYGQGQTSPQAWHGAKEMTFSYSLFFTKGYGFNKGGKLPGLYFGTSEKDAQGCSGGSRATDCASVRLMWREDGMGEFYTYLPNPSISSRFNANKALCKVAPKSDCNDVYGASSGRGAFTFPTGEWTTVAMRVLLNDSGEANGEIELFVNGQSKIHVKGLIISSSSAVRAQGIMAQSFFGGSNASWKSPKDQAIYFADFSVAITQTF